MPELHDSVQPIQLATWGSVSGIDLIGERCDKFVAPGSEVGGDAVFGSRERGEYQEPTGSHWLFPIGWNASGQRAGGTDNNGLYAAQENAQTFLFNRRMKSADDTLPGVAPLGSLIVGGKNNVTRTPGRAEESRFRQCKQIEVAEGGQLRGSFLSQTLRETCRVSQIAGRNGLERLGHGGRSSTPSIRVKNHAPFEVPP